MRPSLVFLTALGVATSGTALAADPHPTNPAEVQQFDAVRARGMYNASTPTVKRKHARHRRQGTSIAAHADIASWLIGNEFTTLPINRPAPGDSTMGRETQTAGSGRSRSQNSGSTGSSRSGNGNNGNNGSSGNGNGNSGSNSGNSNNGNSGNSGSNGSNGNNGNSGNSGSRNSGSSGSRGNGGNASSSSSSRDSGGNASTRSSAAAGAGAASSTRSRTRDQSSSSPTSSSQKTSTEVATRTSTNSNSPSSDAVVNSQVTVTGTPTPNPNNHPQPQKNWTPVIAGVSVAGGVVLLAIIGIVIAKLFGRRIMRWFRQDEIKWPELQQDTAAAGAPLPARQTGGAGFDMGDESDDDHREMPMQEAGVKPVNSFNTGSMYNTNATYGSMQPSAAPTADNYLGGVGAVGQPFPATHGEGLAPPTVQNEGLVSGAPVSHSVQPGETMSHSLQPGAAALPSSLIAAPEYSSASEYAGAPVAHDGSYGSVPVAHDGAYAGAPLAHDGSYAAAHESYADAPTGQAYSTPTYSRELYNGASNSPYDTEAYDAEAYVAQPYMQPHYRS